MGQRTERCCELCYRTMGRNQRRKRCKACISLVCGECMTQHGICWNCAKHAEKIVSAGSSNSMFTLTKNEAALVLRNDKGIEVILSTCQGEEAQNNNAIVRLLQRLLLQPDLAKPVHQLVQLAENGMDFSDFAGLTTLSVPDAEPIKPKDLN
jgi:hypothetical protein